MRHEVTDVDTAAALGSGDVPVLGTPRLIAWLEAATVRAASGILTPGQTSVGTAIRIEHRRPTPVGATVHTIATRVSATDGRRLRFAVEAVDSGGHVVASGEIDRVIVDRETFLAETQDRTT